MAYSTNNLNQYLQAGTVSFGYDANGNLSNDGINTYGYDELNHLSTMTNSADTASYSYDPFGRRVSKTVNGAITYFIYDGDRVIEERNASGDLAAYVYGTGIDEVLTMERGDVNYYYLQDGLGSVREITDKAGNVVENYTYDVYGRPSPAVSAISNPYLFTGRRLDEESGIYYYRARMYDPNIGRFLQRDPLGYWDGMNLYAYVSNNPINLVDPFGLNAWCKAKCYLGKFIDVHYCNTTASLLYEQECNNLGCYRRVEIWRKNCVKRAEKKFKDCIEGCKKEEDCP